MTGIFCETINEKGMLAGKAAGDAILTITAPGGKQFAVKVRVADV